MNAIAIASLVHNMLPGYQISMLLRYHPLSDLSLSFAIAGLLRWHEL